LTESTEIQANLRKIGTWRRILFMLIFAVIASLVRIVLWAIVILQVVSSLVTGSANRNVLDLGRILTVYVYNILLFLTYNTDVMPFPFADWNGHSVPD
jgi:Domain of unknown function (DUF4389)